MGELAKMGISKRQPSITGAHATIPKPVLQIIENQDDLVTIVVTRAFGPEGDNLVGLTDITFDDYPALTLLVKTNEKQGLVHFSPIRGDNRKIGFTDIECGTVCELCCPVSGRPIAKLNEAPEHTGTDYFSVYLTPDLDLGDSIAISNVWGHFHCRVVDNFELLSTWAEVE